MQSMDTFETKLGAILARINGSSLTEIQKADAYVAIHNGLRTLVWPILISHIPESDLKDAVDHPETMTVARYGELMGKAMSSPGVPREIHEEVMGALGEIEDLLTKQGIPAIPTSPPAEMPQ